MFDIRKTVLTVFIVVFSLPVLVQAGSVDLPRTGQTTSYAAGDDGDIEAGVAWPISRFTDNGDGTITDSLTGLMWLKDAGCFGFRHWESAVGVVSHFNSAPDDYNCEDYSGGYSDWVLPNINEIESLLNAEEASNGGWLESQGFVDIQAQYWSSTTHAEFTEQAWYFGTGGSIAYSSKTPTNFRVWPVRSTSSFCAALWQTGQTVSYTAGDDGELRRGVSWPNPRFTDDGDGTVTDNLTSLIWLKDSNCLGVKTWLAAFDTVADFNTDPAKYNCEDYSDNNDDWRLPNRKEFLSLVDRSQFGPALPLNHPFAGNVSKTFWSSTTNPTTSGAWYARMSYGFFSPSSKHNSYQVWAVRHPENSGHSAMPWLFLLLDD